MSGKVVEFKKSNRVRVGHIVPDTKQLVAVEIPDAVGNVIEVKFDATRITQELLSEFRDVQQTEEEIAEGKQSDGLESVELISKMLSTVIIEWNLSDEDDKGHEVDVAINMQSMRRLGFGTLNLIAERIFEKMNPPKATE